MTKTIYSFFLALFFLSCSTTKNLQFDTSNCDFDDKVKDKEKTIDINKYPPKKGGWVLVDNDTLQISISKYSTDYWYVELNKKTSFRRILSYDKNTLKIQSLRFNFQKGNFDIGNEYIYNDKGEIIKTINHDQYDKYPICYKDAIKLTTKKAGKNFVFLGLQRDSIEDKNKNNRFTWRVYYEDAASKNPTLIHKSFYVDAKTGEIVKVVVK